MTVPALIHAWQMVEAPAGGFELQETSYPVPELKPGEALVEIAGCGLCGTDLGFLHGESPLASKPPVVLGHEISGTVVAGSPAALGRGAVLPCLIACRRCDLCKAGRFNRCLNQTMLGTTGLNGGYASHIVVPEADLTFVPEGAAIPLAVLSVIADAVSTPFQALRRVKVRTGDKLLLIAPAGGVGVYATQWARQMGAGLVIGIGRRLDKVEALKPHGLDLALSSSGETAQSLRQHIWTHCRALRINPGHSWTIVELSGSPEGIRLAFDLMNYATKVVLVGFGHQPVALDPGRLVAFDGEIHGSWGCASQLYPEILAEVLAGRILIEPFVELRPMRTIRESFAEMNESRASLKRIVLTPDWAAP